MQIPLSPFCLHLRALTRWVRTWLPAASWPGKWRGRAQEAAGWTGKTSPWEQLIAAVTYAFINGRLPVRAFQAVYQEIPVHARKKVKLLCLSTSSIGKQQSAPPRITERAVKHFTAHDIYFCFHAVPLSVCLARECTRKPEATPTVFLPRYRTARAPTTHDLIWQCGGAAATGATRLARTPNGSRPASQSR